MSDRKYRQQGYQDSGSSERSRRRQPPKRDPSAGPRGRGLGKPTATVFRCVVCGTQQPLGKVPTDEACTQCGAALHTCTHCNFFDTSVHRECRQDEAEYVASKAKANECPYFEPRVTQEFDRESERPADAKAAFDALFDF